jgi:hypothetical protein
MENKQCGEIRKEKKEKKKAKATNKYGECRNSPVPKTVELVDLPSRERKRKTGARIYRMVEGVWSDINKVVFFVVVVGIVVVCCPRESPVVVVRRHTHTHTTSELVIVSYKSAIHWALENGRRRSHRPLQSSSSFFSFLSCLQGQTAWTCGKSRRHSYLCRHRRKKNNRTTSQKQLLRELLMKAPHRCEG